MARDTDMPLNCGEHLVLRETPKAILVSNDDITGEHKWIPKSVIHDNSEIWKTGQQGDLVVKQWFAEKQGWI
jgi:hypothetical protein